jgi:hypothetical protein
MKNNQNEIALLLGFLAVFMTAAVGLGVYFYYQQKAQPNPVPVVQNVSENNSQEPVPESVVAIKIPLAEDDQIATTTITQDTAGWQTYRNEEHRFELEYPADFFWWKDDPKEVDPKDLGWINCDATEFVQNCSIVNGEGYSTMPFEYNGTKYCRNQVGDGAMGSVYETYQYVAIKNNKCFSFNFTVRFSNCELGAFEKSVCEEDTLQKLETIKNIEKTFKYIN